MNWWIGSWSGDFNSVAVFVSFSLTESEEADHYYFVENCNIGWRDFKTNSQRLFVNL
jgi:hypothetical protein